MAKHKSQADFQLIVNELYKTHHNSYGEELQIVNTCNFYSFKETMFTQRRDYLDAKLNCKIDGMLTSNSEKLQLHILIKHFPFPDTYINKKKEQMIANHSRYMKRGIGYDNV